MAENKIYDDGIESFSKLTVLGENLLIFCMIIIGVIGMLPFQLYYLPIISIIYLLFSLVMLFFLLRKHLCTNCYYYNKWCHCGWGKLASLIFKKHTGNQNLGGKLANITWAFIMILPIVIMISILILNLYQFYSELYLFISFLILVLINGLLHKIDCEKCKMRNICPGSAAKQ